MERESTHADGKPSAPWSLVEIEEELAFLAKATAREANTPLDWLNLHEEVRKNADLRDATQEQWSRFNSYVALIESMQCSPPDAD